MSEIASNELAEKYEKEFRPESYIEVFYSRTFLLTYTSNVLGILHRIFSIYISDAESMLDLGCGPTVFATIPASRRIRRIISSDFLEKNLQEVRKWVHDELGALNWSNCFVEVSKLENEQDATILEQRVRNAIKKFVHCDVRLPNPISPHTEQFDVVFSSLMYESVATSEEMFAEFVSNSANLLKSGGHFIYGGVFNATSYHVGDSVFPVYPSTKATVDNALAAAKLKPLLWTIFPRLAWDNSLDEFDSMFVVLAKK